MVLGGFTSSGREVILDRLTVVEFLGGFADRAAIPAQFALGQTLAPVPESFDHLSHEQASVAAFEFVGGVNVEPLEVVRKFHSRCVEDETEGTTTPDG